VKAMWKVKLKDSGYNYIEFNFENYCDVTEFICNALLANRNIQAIVTLESEYKAVEEGEE
jgi:hypothetical protein